MKFKIGDTFTSNNFGRFKIGKFDGADHAWVVFEDTGNVALVTLRLIQANGVVDYKGHYEVKVGGLYNTSNYGKVRVVKITNSKSVRARFVDTGNEVEVQKSAIMSGLLVDKVAVLLKAEEDRKMKVAEEKAKKELLEEEKRLKQERALSAKEDARLLREAELQAQREAKRVLGSDGEIFLGTEHTDKLGFKFTIMDRVGLTKKWLVKYHESGNEYTCAEGNIKRFQVFDTKIPDFFALKAAYDKKQAALYYEANRERLLKRASDYQKNNLVRARVRNQNRRSRRVDAEGSHTFEEVDNLYLAQDGKCACCGIPLDDSKHLDHIYPLALGGTNYIWNLQWLCQFCNNSKSAAHPDDWELYSKSEHFTERLKSRGSTTLQ